MAEVKVALGVSWKENTLDGMFDNTMGMVFPLKIYGGVVVFGKPRPGFVFLQLVICYYVEGIAQMLHVWFNYIVFPVIEKNLNIYVSVANSYQLDPSVKLKRIFHQTHTSFSSISQCAGGPNKKSWSYPWHTDLRIMNV